MRAVVQRVTNASVSINGRVKSAIGPGLLVFLGIEQADTEEDVAWLAGKIARLRIFADADGAMNLSAAETGREVLVISQFTLHASTKKGNRPSFVRAARPDTALPLYEQFVNTLEAALPGRVGTGAFGAMMQVSLVNDGPVTIVIDTRNRE